MTHGKFLRGMAAGSALAVVAFFGLHGYAQITNPGGGISISDVLPLLPSPATTAPQTESIVPVVGASTAYMRADAKMPRITRVAMVTTDASGNWAVTWSTALSATPAVLAVPVNSATQPIVCNVTTVSTTGATGNCQMARTLPSTLTLLTSLINYAVFQVPPTGSTVQILAIPPSQ